MPIINKNNAVFSWIGDGFSKSQRRKTTLHFRALELNGVEFKIGDFVLIRNDDQIDPEDETSCYVAQIKDLYEIDDESQPHQAKVLWFSRALELPTHALKHFDELNDFEIVEENRSHWSDEIDAETIFGKCHVTYLPVDADLLSACSKKNATLEFFCRYKFSGTKLFPAWTENASVFSSLTSSSLISQSSKIKRTPKSSKKNKDASKDLYCALDISTSKSPKILIKKLEESLVQSVKSGSFFMSSPKTVVDEISDALQSSLVINSNSKPDCSSLHKIQTIQSPSGSASAKGKAKRALFPQISADNNSPLLKDDNKKVTCSKRSYLPRSNSTSTPRKSLRMSDKKHSCSELNNSTAYEESNFINNQNVLTPRKSSRKLTPSKKFSPSGSNEVHLVDKILSIPNENISTPRKSARKLVSKMQYCDTITTPSKNINESTPRRSSRKVRVNTPTHKPEGASDILEKPLSKICNLTPKKSAMKQSLNKIQSHISNISSPKKKNLLTPKKILKFQDNEVAFTRSGRKVKSVNYYVQENFGDEKTATFFSPEKKKPLSKFIRKNYSDDSGSESDYAMSEESSSDEDLVSDCSLLDESCKPLPKKKTPILPRSSKKDKKLVLPDRKTPLKTPQNILEESRLRLHVSAVPKSLPCREEEYLDIYSFVKGCLSSFTGGCMYISGVPGTGKTATVHEVIRNLEEEKEEGEVPTFKFVEVNGMWMTDPYQCYVHIYKALTGKTIASQQAANLLEKRFTESGPKKDAIILLVDELDRLWTRKQTVMYNIFDWPSKKNSRLIVLAIANTMDLPERLMMNRISSRLGLTRKTFQPYNFKQLQEIIMSRIQELEVFDPDAVQLVARKVAAVSGDARRALDICRHATELVETKSSPKKKQKVLIGMEHVDVAIQQMFSSPIIAAVRSSSEISKLFLKTMLSEFNRTGSEETTLMKVSQQIIDVCQFEGFPPPNGSQISKVCSHLVSSHLLLVDNFLNDIHMKLRLSVSPDDVNYALTSKVI